MPRLPNSLVYDLLDVAQVLSETSGRPNLRKAALRRSVSTAYYAVFHALCFLCASELVGWSRSDELEPIYRSIEHGLTRSRLARAARQNSRLVSLETAFASLQDQRHASDYAPAGLRNVSRGATKAAIQLARQAIAVIETMDQRERLKLAILLIAKRVEPSS